jgi:hypothetical protein
MEPTPQTLIGALPPYEDKWMLVHPNQSVGDIIAEVVDAHKEFAPYYDKIALYFDDSDLDAVCETLYRFCKKNLSYYEETEDEQSTALPTGLLVRGYCDCKGYAGFCGGVLDAIKRMTGKKINWSYRFASYDMFDSTPHHVFIVVKDPDGSEIWIDPTPKASSMQPVWQVDKKISGMPLIRNISGIGIASLTVTPKTDAPAQMNFNNTEAAILRNMWPHYLGLSGYRDYSGDRDINEWDVAAALNSLIAESGGTHQVTGDFVKWVYDNSIRSWNFYYPGGVEPNFDGRAWIDTYQAAMNQPGWPYLVVTPDGRLTLDHDVELDDYRNAGIHILNAWAQDIINRMDGSPYPLKPADLKIFSQSYTGNPGNPNANLFSEHRGTSVFTDIGKALESTVNFVKEAVMKVIGFVPRNAFLSLVGLNVFHMATDLSESITKGHWDDISRTWQKLGGNPDKLKNTIEHGSGQPAIEDEGQSVDVPEGTVGAVQIAAILAAAAPIIMALLKFMNKDGKLNPFIETAKSALQAQFPDSNFDFLDGILTQNGTPVDYTVDPQYDENLLLLVGKESVLSKNYVAVAAVGGIGTYYVLNKGKQKKNILVPLAVGGGLFYFLMRAHQQYEQRLAAARLKLLQQQQAATQQPTGMPTSGDWSGLIDLFGSGADSGGSAAPTSFDPVSDPMGDYA